MGLPVIATNWSGSTEFLLENASLPLRIDGLEPVENGPKGHQWAKPSEAHLRELMRWAAEHRAEARSLGEARARSVHLRPPTSRCFKWGGDPLGSLWACPGCSQVDAGAFQPQGRR